MPHYNAYTRGEHFELYRNPKDNKPMLVVTYPSLTGSETKEEYQKIMKARCKIATSLKGRKPNKRGDHKGLTLINLDPHVYEAWQGEALPSGNDLPDCPSEYINNSFSKHRQKRKYQEPTISTYKQLQEFFHSSEMGAFLADNGDLATKAGEIADELQDESEKSEGKLTSHQEKKIKRFFNDPGLRPIIDDYKENHGNLSDLEILKAYKI